MALETRPITNEIIKEVATDAMIDRGYCADLDSCVKIGVYYTSVNTTGTFPPIMGNLAKYAVLEVLNRGGQKYQRLTCETGIEATRVKNTNSDWGNWKEPVYH